MNKVATNSVAFAFVMFAGSCVIQANSQTFSVSSSTTTVQVYTASPAPATVHVNALNLPDHPTDWLAEAYHWNFGDATGQTAIDPRTGKAINLNTVICGPVAAYQYEHQGTYNVLLTRTLASGQNQSYAAQIVVPASSRKVFYISPDGNDANPGTDQAHPLKSAAAAVAHLADHTEFRFRRGSVYPIQTEFPMKKHDLMIDCYGDAAQPLPVIQRLNLPAKAGAVPMPADDCEIFTTWPGQTFDVTIRHIRIDSTFTAATTADHYAYHAPVATFGHVRGSNITIADCEFQNILEGPLGDPTGNGVLLLRNRQVDPLGIPSRNFWLEGQNIVVIGNVSTNSVNESPYRAAGTGIINGLIAFNDIAQQLDAAHNRASTKAAVTLRCLQDVEVIGNRITNAEFSFDPQPLPNLDQRVVVENNAVFNSDIDIKCNVRHAMFRGNAIQRDGGPCITLYFGTPDPAWWMEDLQIVNNTGQGWLSDGVMMQLYPHTPAQLLQFVYDPTKNPYTKIPAPTSQSTH